MYKPVYLGFSNLQRAKTRLVTKESIQSSKAQREKVSGQVMTSPFGRGGKNKSIMWTVSLRVAAVIARILNSVTQIHSESVWRQLYANCILPPLLHLNSMRGPP